MDELDDIVAQHPEVQKERSEKKKITVPKPEPEPQEDENEEEDLNAFLDELEEDDDIEEPTVAREEPKDSKDVTEIYFNSINELVRDHRKDRDEITEFIDLLKSRINREENETRPNRIYFEALMSAYKTRSETSSVLMSLISNLGKKKESEGLAELSDLLEEDDEK